jgi:hypothetical protein
MICEELKDNVGKHLSMSAENTYVKFERQNPDLPLARKASSHLILQGAIDEAANLEPPPMF